MKKFKLIRAKQHLFSLKQNKYVCYLTDTEEFKSFCHGVIDLENPEALEFQRNVSDVLDTTLVGHGLYEDRRIQGIEEIVKIKSKKAIISFMRLSENIVYVLADDGFYYRGIKFVFGDIGLKTTDGYNPLDKYDDNLNPFEIVVYNKRKTVKSVKVIHNKIESCLYLVDFAFRSFEDVEEDMKNPRKTDFQRIFEFLYEA